LRAPSQSNQIQSNKIRKKISTPFFWLNYFSMNVGDLPRPPDQKPLRRSSSSASPSFSAVSGDGVVAVVLARLAGEEEDFAAVVVFAAGFAGLADDEDDEDAADKDDEDEEDGVVAGTAAPIGFSML
jgi:hypothetical protein